MQEIFNNIKKYKKKIGLIDTNNKQYSYKKILEEAEKIGQNVLKNSLIVLISSNTFESVVGYIAFVKNNNILLLLDESADRKFVKKMIHKYQPSYIYKPKNYLFDKVTYKKIVNSQNYELLRTRFKLKNNYNRKNFLLLTTSGSTSNPKLVRLSKVNITNNTIKIQKYLNINTNNITITTMPMAYSYGLSIINTYINSGSKIILNKGTVFEKVFWDKIVKFKVNSLSGVPEFFEFLQKLKIEKFKIKKFKYLTHAGGKLDNKIIKYFVNFARSKKFKFYSMYGQTEAGPRMSFVECTNNYKKIGTIGKPLKNSKFTIVDAKNKIINSNYKIGELVYEGKNVCLGYASKIKDLYKGDVNKGKLFTGDLGYKDSDGFYHLTGRKNRISKIFGLRFNLDDIERKLKKNNFNTKIIPSNKYLKILIADNYDINKIKNLIHDLYKINKNFILINKVKMFKNKNLFSK